MKKLIAFIIAWLMLISYAQFNEVKKKPSFKVQELYDSGFLLLGIDAENGDYVPVQIDKEGRIIFREGWN